MRRALWFGLAIVLLFPAPALPVRVPPAPAPEGFSWQRIEEVHASFLMPDGWHLRSEASGGTLAYFFTPGKLKKGDIFDTGLTINVFKKLKDKDAVAYAQAFVAEAAKQHEALDGWKLEAGVLHGFGVVTRQLGQPGEVAHLISYHVIGNARTNTLYLLWFESPEPAWEEEWKKGKRMLTQFMLDDEV